MKGFYTVGWEHVEWSSCSEAPAGFKLKTIKRHELKAYNACEIWLKWHAVYTQTINTTKWLQWSSNKPPRDKNIHKQIQNEQKKFKETTEAQLKRCKGTRAIVY